MGSFARTCEFVEEKEELSSFVHSGHIYHPNPGFSLVDKDLEDPVLKLGYTGSLEDDINQLFESISMRTSSKGMGQSHNIDTATSSNRSTSSLRSNALKKPNSSVEMPRSPGIGTSETVSLKQALRDLCISKASEMAATKRVPKIPSFPGISEVGRGKSLYNPILVESGSGSGLSFGEAKGNIVKIPLMLEECKKNTFEDMPQHALKKNSTSKSTWNSAGLVVHYSNGIMHQQNGIDCASGKVENQESKLRKANISTHSLSHCSSSDGVLELNQNASASKRSVNEATMLKSSQQGRLHNIPSSTLINSRRTGKLTRNASRVAKPMPRNKVSVKKKVKQGSKPGVLPANRYGKIDGIFDPITNQLLCHRCHCALKKASRVSNQESPMLLNVSHNSNATSDTVESCVTNTRTGINSRSVASDYIDDNTEVGSRHVGSYAKDDSEEGSYGCLASLNVSHCPEVSSVKVDSDLKNAGGNKDSCAPSGFNPDAEIGLIDVKSSMKNTNKDYNEDVLVQEEYNKDILVQEEYNEGTIAHEEYDKDTIVQCDVNHIAEVKVGAEKSGVTNARKEVYKDTPTQLNISSYTEIEPDNAGPLVQKPNISENCFKINGELAEKGRVYITTREKGEPSQSSKDSIGGYSSSTSASEESNQSRSSSGNRPHMSKDVRWEAIQHVRMQQGVLGLRHFNLLKKLGCGDIGTVYLAELIGTNCLFAIKVMDNEFLERRKKMPRAQTERDILRMLDHPFLPTLYAHFNSDELSCLVMEYCPGGDLHVLRQKQPGRCFPEPAARFYVAEVLLAMEYLHMLGVIYRDLKPENILVRDDGHIMVTDFDLSLRSRVNPTLLKSSSPSSIDSARFSSGRAGESNCIQPFCVQPSYRVSCFIPKLLSTSKRSRCKKLKRAELIAHFRLLPQLVAEPTDARSNSFVGTHEYLAPEIIKGEGHGSAVDWWTFGVFLYELLYGRTPFKGSTNEETLANVVLQSLKFPDNPQVSFQAKDLIKGLLVKEPENRLGSEKGAADIKRHPVFAGLNWALIRCAIPPELPDFYELNGVSQENRRNYLECKAIGEHLEFELF